MHKGIGVHQMCLAQLGLSLVLVSCAQADPLTPVGTAGYPAQEPTATVDVQTAYPLETAPTRVGPKGNGVTMPTELDPVSPTEPPPTPTFTPGPAYRSPYDEDNYSDFVVDYLLFRFDPTIWTKDHVDYNTGFYGVLSLSGDILHHQQIPGCVMGENVGRGLIGTGLSLGSANRTLGDRLFGVTTFGSDGIYGPYAVVENVVAVEYPEQPEACWEAIDDVLVTMSLKIQ